MALHAVGDIDDAIDATKAFLLPFDIRTWLRLAFVVFFIGGGGSLGGVQNLGNLDSFGDGAPGAPGGVPQVPDPSQVQPGVVEPITGLGLALVALVVVLVLLLALLFAVLGATMEFVFVRSLVDTEVHVRRYLRSHLRDGIRLLVFRFVVGALSLLVFGGALLGAVFLITGGDLSTLSPSAVLGSLGILILILVVAALVVGTINGFTNVFVVPLMVQGDHGVLAGWRRLWASIRTEPKQYLAYLFLSVVLAIGVSIVGGVLGAIAFVVVLIPFGIVGFGLWVALHGGGLAAGVAVSVVALLFVVTMLVVANLIKAPLQAFLRYYAMLVLGDVDADLDPIPEVRTAIRE